MVWLTLVSLLVLAVMTYHNWTTNKNTIYLSSFLLLFTLYALTHYWMVVDIQPTYAAILFNHLTPLYLLAGPLLYFYVRGVLKDEFSLNYTDGFHLIPAGIQLIAITPYLFTVSFENKAELVQALSDDPTLLGSTEFNWIFSTAQNSIIRLGLFLGYLVVSARLLILHLLRSKPSLGITLQRSVVLRWLLYLHFSITLIIGLYLHFLYRFGQDASYLSESSTITLQTVIAMIIVLNNLSLLLFPELLFGIPRIPSINMKAVSKTQNSAPTGLRFKDQAYFVDLGKRFKSYMKEQRPYLAKDFSLGDAALALNVPQHHLTLCIREIFDDNFTGIRNTYRVKYAHKILTDPQFSHKTIDAISDEAGFTSRTSFYKAFDRQFGISPSELRG